MTRRKQGPARGAGDADNDLELRRQSRGAFAAIAAAHPELTTPEARARASGYLEDLARENGREGMAKAGKGKATATGPETKSVTVRMPVSLLDEIDKVTALIQAERPDSIVKQADAIRVLLVDGITARKAKAGKK